MFKDYKYGDKKKDRNRKMFREMAYSNAREVVNPIDKQLERFKSTLKNGGKKK